MAFLKFPRPGGGNRRRPIFASGGPAVRRWRLLLLLAGLACLVPARAQSTKEYQIKAAFLFNFVQFVTWPPDAFASSGAPLEIGILGDDPFGSALEEVVRGESVNSHRLVVVRSQNIGDLMGCQMIFVSRSEAGQVTGILSQVNSRPILTVSDIDHFAEDGGDIAFYLSDGKVRFQINPGSVRHGGMAISSQLLNLGQLVGGNN
jgi:hypothetical protein